MKNKLKYLKFLVNAMWIIALDDPAGFISKASIVIGVSEKRLVRRITSLFRLIQDRKVGDLGERFQTGQVEELAKLKHSGRRLSFLQRRLVEKAKFLMEEFGQEIVASKIAESTEISGNINVLYYVTNSLPFTRSGYTFRTHMLGRHTQLKGIEMLVATRIGYPLIIGKIPRTDGFKIDGVSYQQLVPKVFVRSRIKRNLLAAKLVAEKAAEHRAHLLHTTTDFRNAIPVSIAASQLKVPWIYEVRGELENTWLTKTRNHDAAFASSYYRFCRSAEELAMRAASHVIVLSEVSKKQLIARGIESEKISVIPNSVDSAFLTKEFDKELIRKELRLEGRILGTVTSVVEYEGLDLAIESLAKMPNDVILVIVGKGESVPSLKALATRLGLSDRVRFVGEVDQLDAWKWYASFDAFVLPRKDLEVCRVVTPVKPLIAQAFGIPVIASDLPALREICAGTGRFFEPESQADFIRVTLNALDEKIEKRHAHAWLRTYTWEHAAEKLIEVYEKVLSANS